MVKLCMALLLLMVALVSPALAQVARSGEETMGILTKLLGLQPGWAKKLPTHMRPTHKQVILLEEIRKQLNVHDDQFALAIAGRPATTRKVQYEIYRQLKQARPDWSEQELLAGVLRSRLQAAWSAGDMWLTTDEEFERVITKVRTLDDLCDVIVAHEKEGEGIDSTGWVRDRIDQILESEQSTLASGPQEAAYLLEQIRFGASQDETRRLLRAYAIAIDNERGIAATGFIHLGVPAAVEVAYANGIVARKFIHLQYQERSGEPGATFEKAVATLQREYGRPKVEGLTAVWLADPLFITVSEGQGAIVIGYAHRKFDPETDRFFREGH